MSHAGSIVFAVCAWLVIVAAGCLAVGLVLIGLWVAESIRTVIREYRG